MKATSLTLIAALIICLDVSAGEMVTPETFIRRRMPANNRLQRTAHLRRR
jgi:hypothetical protein